MKKTFWNKLKWYCSSIVKIDKADVEFKLITINGNVIYSKDIPCNLYKRFYKKREDWFFISKIEQDGNIQKSLNMMANKYLTESQKKQRKKLQSGVLDTGKYIVKCVWDLRTRQYEQDLTYEEYLEWLQEKENKK